MGEDPVRPGLTLSEGPGAEGMGDGEWGMG